MRPIIAATVTVRMDDDFHRAQRWTLYEMDLHMWDTFMAANRVRYGERPVIRAGSFYTRIGYSGFPTLEARMIRALYLQPAAWPRPSPPDHPLADSR